MLQEVVSLNNLAISYLRMDRNEEAVSLLTKAMVLVQQCSVQDFDADVLRVYEIAARVRFPTISEVVASPYVALNLMPSDANDALFEVYTRPFLISDSVMIPPSVLRIALSFNTGLVYHRLGLQNNSLDNLKTAVQYYQYGLCMVKQNAREGYSSHGMYWLSLALLTNAGNILWSLWCTKEALECRQRVQLLLGTK